MKGFIQLNRRGLLAVLMAFMMMLAIPSSVFAEEENYYPTWNSYTEEHADDSVTWNDVVDAMDLVIDAAKERYASGDADGAYNAINDAYYGYYETTGFERTTMGYISSARKSEMELQFSSCKSIAKDGGSAEEFNKEADKLKSMLREDAHTMDGTQEVIEGVTALIAVVVLYYVSNWMLSKSESEAWTKYIKDKVSDSAEKGGGFALAFTAFLAVFREGAEVILFYQPLLAGDNISMVWAGFGVGCVCLVFVYLAIRVLSLRIPLKPFFTATSVLMFIMSISFLGSGIKELIEGDVLMMHSPSWVSWIPSNPVLEVLGIYPAVETIVPQLILLGVTVVLFIWHTNRNKKLREEASQD